MITLVEIRHLVLGIIIVFIASSSVIGAAAPTSNTTGTAIPVNLSNQPEPDFNTTFSERTPRSASCTTNRYEEQISINVTRFVNDTSQIRLRFNTSGLETPLQFTFPEQVEVISHTSQGDIDGTGVIFKPNTSHNKLVYTVDTTNTVQDAFNYAASTTWAVLPLPEVTAYVNYTSQEPIAVGDQLAYFGPHDRIVTERGCHSVEIIYPENRTIKQPQQLLTTLLYADRHLPPISRDSEVTYIVSQEVFDDVSGTERWGDILMSGAFVTGNGSRYTWIHEYIHTRETFGPDWAREAFAEYLALRLALESGVYSETQYKRVLQWRYRNVNKSTILTNKSSWEGTNDEYDRGAIVVAALDTLIRDRTDESQTIMRAYEILLRKNATSWKNKLPNAVNQTISRSGGSTSNVVNWTDYYLTHSVRPPLRMVVGDPITSEQKDRKKIIGLPFVIVGVAVFLITIVIGGLLISIFMRIRQRHS